MRAQHRAPWGLSPWPTSSAPRSLPRLPLPAPRGRLRRRSRPSWPPRPLISSALGPSSRHGSATAADVPVSADAGVASLAGSFRRATSTRRIGWTRPRRHSTRASTMGLDRQGERTMSKETPRDGEAHDRGASARGVGGPSEPGAEPSRPAAWRPFHTDLLAGALIAIAVALLIVQDGHSVRVNWLVFEFRSPGRIILFVTAAAGAVVWEVVRVGFCRMRCPHGLVGSALCRPRDNVDDGGRVNVSTGRSADARRGRSRDEAGISLEVPDLVPPAAVPVPASGLG